MPYLNTKRLSSVELICPTCGVAFVTKGSKAQSRRYCSKSCYRSPHSTDCTCLQCGKAFRAPNNAIASGGGRYCSLACSGRAKSEAGRQTEYTCEVCGKLFRRTPRANATPRFCSRSCKAQSFSGNSFVDKKGYVHVWLPEHPVANSTGYVLEHRLVVSREIGRPLRIDEHIHHVDEDPGNNAPENLMIVTAEEHRRIHNRKTAHRLERGPELIGGIVARRLDK